MTAYSQAEAAARTRGGFDRCAGERAHVGLLDELRADEATRVLVVRGDAAELTGGDAPTLRFVRVADAPDDALWAFLGRTEDGRAVLLARTGGSGLPEGRWVSLRATAGALSPADTDVFVTAVSLGRWLRDSAFCPRCGDRAGVENAGWSRRCVSCGAEHFPRTDPAIIVAVTSAAEPERILLGSNALWGADRYSCFAGFVEAGETAESAVARELYEEAGVRVRDIEYRQSQAWPYPRSLMLGFRARALDDAQARPDGEEIAALRWFAREEIGAALERGDWTRGGDGVLLPGRASIAHRLIADWYAETV